MDGFSVQRQYEQYLEALSYCNGDTLGKSEEDILYDLFEALEPTLRCSLCDYALERLREAGYLDDAMVELSREIYEQALPLFEREWTLAEIRRSRDWMSVMSLVDQALLRIHRKTEDA